MPVPPRRRDLFFLLFSAPATFLWWNVTEHKFYMLSAARKCWFIALFAGCFDAHLATSTGLEPV